MLVFVQILNQNFFIGESEEIEGQGPDIHVIQKF